MEDTGILESIFNQNLIENEYTKQYLRVVSVNNVNVLMKIHTNGWVSIYKYSGKCTIRNESVGVFRFKMTTSC